MPVDVTVEEPGTSIVGAEAEGHVVLASTNAEHVSSNGVHVVVCGAASGADDVESVLEESATDVSEFVRCQRNNIAGQQYVHRASGRGARHNAINQTDVCNSLSLNVRFHRRALRSRLSC